MRSGTRALAVRFLRDLFRRQKQIDSLGEDPDFLNLDSRDRRLVTEIVYGTLRNRGLLDYYIQELSKRALPKLDDIVLWILRVALYQTEFLRVPDRAAVYEAVQLCRLFRKGSASSFVNGVLRGFLANRPDLPAGDSPQALAVRFSHPEWLVRRYLARYGVEEAKQLLSRNNEPPLPFVWVNPFKTDLASFRRRLEEDELEYEIYHALPNCVIVRAPAFSQHRLYRQGLCFLMDVSSQEIAHLAPLQGRRILGDFCCAPGGKYFILASRKAKDSNLYGCDLSWRRLLETRQRAELYAVPDGGFVNADLSVGVPFRELFDFVLLDVPCSGLGTLRSNPDIRWRIREEELARFHALQVSLLRNALSALRPGGELLYVTCSTEPEENEWVVEELIEQQQKALLVGDFRRTYPYPHPGDCFFAALLGGLASPLKL